MELNREKLNILEMDAPKIFVNACAASGKTTLLIEKIKRVINSGMNPKDMCVITFTRNAAQNLIERLGDLYDEEMFVGTIHALAAHFLAINGKGAVINKYAKEEKFDELFESCKTDLIIDNPFKWVLLDEAQDSSKCEFEFIFDLINPPNFFVVGDERQSIYRFKGARPDLLRKYMRKYDAVECTLKENYRNARNILDKAKDLSSSTGIYDDSKPMKDEDGRIIYLGKDFGTLIKYIKASPNYGEWAILTRTNRQQEAFREALGFASIPYVSFKQGDISKKQLDEIMNGNSVKLLTIHSAKGLEWENVCVAGMRYWRNNAEEPCVNYVAVTRAKEFLIIMK